MQLEQGLFPTPQSSLPKEVKRKKIEARCQLFIRKTVPSESKETILEDQKYENYRIILTTSGDYVFEQDPLSDQTKSGFKCDFEIKFWMIRAPSIIANTVGKVKGIAFQFPRQTQNQTVSLFLDEQCTENQIKSLQNFASALERKYIVQKQFHQKYKAIKRIGKGVTACVYSSLCLIDKSQVAIKSFKKEVYFNQEKGIGKKGFLKEFKILTQLNCTYLSKLLGVYDSDQSIYIVQELLDRTLHNYLIKFEFPDTTKTRKLLYQLLIGLRYLHKKNIMHRDIKLENILIRGPEKDNITPVIVDFGLAEYQNCKEFVYIRCGTPGYVAPEVINLSKDEKTEIKYNKSCDIFSLGVIFHILQLSFHMIYFSVKLFLRAMKLDKFYKKQTMGYPRISPQIRDILRGMLHLNPQKRYTVEQLMNHAFFVQEKTQFSNEVCQMDKLIFSQLKILEEENGMKSQ